MAMAWSARLKAAWRGEVSDADLAAMFAATTSLAELDQALADRRLGAEIEQVGHDWRALLAVGQIAAPLWLAEALVSLADAFYDGAQAPGAHASHPAASVSAYLHTLVAALLAPVDDIIADVTQALADPGHHTRLTSVLHIGPGGDIAAGAPPDPIGLPYARQLATGAAHVHTSAATLLAAVRAKVEASPAPDWLTAGLQRVNGVLQAAGVRLNMSEQRLAALVGASSGDAYALATIVRELWLVVDAACVAGQTLSDPHLLPEAPAPGDTRPTSAASTTPSPTPPTPPAVTPMHDGDSTVPPHMRARPPAPVVHVTLPQIEPGAEPLRERHESPAPTAPPSGPAQADEVALPTIGAPAPTAPARPPAPQPRPVALPAIGVSARPADRAPEPHAAGEPQPASLPHPKPSAGEPEAPDDPPAFQFPKIG